MSGESTPAPVGVMGVGISAPGVARTSLGTMAGVRRCEVPGVDMYPSESPLELLTACRMGMPFRSELASKTVREALIYLQGSYLGAFAPKAGKKMLA